MVKEIVQVPVFINKPQIVLICQLTIYQQTADGFIGELFINFILCRPSLGLHYAPPPQPPCPADPSTYLPKMGTVAQFMQVSKASLKVTSQHYEALSVAKGMSCMYCYYHMQQIVVSDLFWLQCLWSNSCK